MRNNPECRHNNIDHHSLWKGKDGFDSMIVFCCDCRMSFEARAFCFEEIDGKQHFNPKV